eukprot:m.145891 g.145891  ORF g.145891 m.145891 type:complete len:145 (-) comp13230_c0_seq22:196-630(-)
MSSQASNVSQMDMSSTWLHPVSSQVSSRKLMEQRCGHVALVYKLQFNPVSGGKQAGLGVVAYTHGETHAVSFKVLQSDASTAYVVGAKKSSIKATATVGAARTDILEEEEGILTFNNKRWLLTAQCYLKAVIITKGRTNNKLLE